MEAAMARRLYFLLPDLDSARRTADDLLLARVEDRRMHFLARRGTPLKELNEASPLQKSDVVHGAGLGLVIGAAVGLAVGALFLVAGPDGMPRNNFVVLLGMLACAAFGTWVASMIAVSVPNSRLRGFAAEIDAGSILLMVDVQSSRVDEIRALVVGRHPEASDRGIEPAIPAFP
jgi:hypothetical protein